MLRMANDEDAREQDQHELSRLLHPSHGLPRRLSLVPDDGPGDGGGGAEAIGDHLAEVTRADPVPLFLASRRGGRRTGRR